MEAIKFRGISQANGWNSKSEWLIPAIPNRDRRATLFCISIECLCR